MKTVKAYEILDHGVKHSDYFQGCGTCFTKYTDVATGIGDSAQTALVDALSQLTMSDWDTAIVDEELKNYSGKVTVEYTDETIDPPWHHVSVRVA